MLSSVQKSKHKTYAEAARLKNVSLLHTDITPHPEENQDIHRVLQTRIYRSSRSEGAYLFDITECKTQYTDRQCMVELKKQRPKVHACMALSDGATRYLEAYVTSANDINDIFRTGINFSETKLQVLPCKAITDQSQAITLKLTHLPMFTSEEVLSGLNTSLAIFGNILDIGIITEKTMGFFMGSVYAVLGVYQPDNTPTSMKFQKLSHQISWIESNTEVFRATWNNMPMWCRYCHQDGHTKFTCETSRARTLCYSCHEQGHRSYECPRKNSANIPNKKQDRKTSKISERKDVKHIPSTDSPPPKGDQSPATQEKNAQANELPEKDCPSDDDMHIDDGVESTDDEHEPRYLEEIQTYVKTLNGYNADQVQQAFEEVHAANEITPFHAKGNDGNLTIIGWRLTKETTRAEALITWFNNHTNFDQLSNSPSIHPRRPPQPPAGDGLSKEVNQNN
ncbi:hypothetical protein G6F57_010769 [Rhizopus arrhizus]|uniref:CCHC-type domain-containing protein n=1 Tax=Rhizopus oryzae TaxID=64495 RepID=A0A9P6X1C7_RHIOR|nr:hypothetical protein G6F23_006779 [Rhizopus arrhizus]KAG1423412.1 hypothetical protein G6F58_002824 [Rhizopus delemar]KAG0756573.1 hypothetical protein G6F24_011059 [Rhizopus arrhizus]KAG0783264.1 hypothetical protein G6F21_010638 [Rhizopus arrhizus]KAG0790477.1 hypothetical protein G6F22_006402 [Rhizopus arrhizus]